jgi:phospholipase/carboxylesterase
MADENLEALVAVVPPLMQSLEALGQVSRYFAAVPFEEIMVAVGAPEDALRAALPKLEAWPERLAGLRAALESAGQVAVTAFEGLRAAPDADDAMTAVFRATRGVWRAQEALYPLAADLPPIGRYFTSPPLRADAELAARLADPPPRDDVGVFHFGNERGERGGFSLYVPETYSEDRAWPLVTALHGGSGDGRGFLWSWLRDARSLGTILVSPTSVGRTWGLNNPEADAANLARILAEVETRWNIDPARRLMTGMSDGGTFCYVAGLDAGSPFTHLAPCSASFHPMIAAMADRERLAGLPINIAHGVLDWMFDVAMARGAAETLSAAGAQVTYQEIPDLAHTYPREINPGLLAWLDGANGG